jgi:valyl-tRNA synthetase
MTSYRFNEAANAVYEFFWNDFCDWYIEASKLSLYSEDDAEKNRSVTILMAILEEAMRLAHPFLSFITEEIYQKLPGSRGDVITAPYPVHRAERVDEETAAQFSALQNLIRFTRTVRSEFTVPPEKKVDVHVSCETGYFAAGFFADHAELIRKLTGAGELVFSDARPSGGGNIPVAGVGFEVFVDLRGAIDVEKEIAKLDKELGKQESLKSSTEKKLANARFLENAPADVVEKEHSKLKEFTDRAEKIVGYLSDLKG